MSAVRLESVTKRFGPVTAVDGLDLEIRDGEFFSMLGPSGSGKTTVLRMIAGFEQPTAGRVFLADQDVTRQAPFARDVNTVFQDYALFPHMDVLANVEYGLRVKKVPRAERRKRAEAALESVRLSGYGARRPAQLSGGQRQRVALARALVNRPQGAAARRAARRPRPQAAPRDADRAQAAPARGRHHLRLRHPRPGGGAHDERPDRGLQRRPDRAGRDARRALRVAGVVVRRRLRRHLQPAHRRRGPRESSAATARSAIRPEKIQLARRRRVHRATRPGHDRGGRLPRLGQPLRRRARRRRHPHRAPTEPARHLRPGPRPRRARRAGAGPTSTSSISPATTTASGHPSGGDRHERTSAPLPAQRPSGWRWPPRWPPVAPTVATATAAARPPRSRAASPRPTCRWPRSSATARATLSVLAWPGYAEDGTTDKAVDWVTPFEEETGCQVDVKYFGTSDEAVTLMKSRPVRRGVGLRRRVAAADRRRRRRPGQHRPDPQLRRRVGLPQGPRRGTPSTARCTASRTATAPTC